LGKNIAMQFKHSLQGKEGYDTMIRKRSSMERGHSEGIMGERTNLKKSK
jgi:hypothetical protein